MLEKKSNLSRKYYLSITDGQIVHNENGKKEYFASVEGELENIYKWERNFNGEKVLYWYIDIRGEKDELYSLSFPFRSGAFKSIILALAGVEDIAIARIKIQPYKKDDFTKVVVYSSGEKLDWITKELPAVEEIRIAGQPVKDDTKRMEYISSLVEQIDKKLGK